MDDKRRRVETLAMRISAEEHRRLRLLAVLEGPGEAKFIRRVVNEWCEREGHAKVFYESGEVTA